MNIFSFLASLDEQLTAENGPGLAFLLRPSSPHAKLLLQEHRNPTLQNLARFKGKIAAPWDEIAIHYVLIANNIAKGRADDAFKEQCQLVSLFYRFFIQNGGWTLSALFAILRDLRDLAITADLAKGGGDNMEEAARVISKALGNCMTDRTSPYESSRKWGIYYIVGMVLKCYFRIKRISLSKNVLRALDSNTDRPPLSEYPKGHRVTYRYYLGMIHFLNQEHSQAENELTLAFYECHIDAHANQERILTYLLPLRMLRGHLPSDDLLARFPALHELYSPFIHAIKNGDLRTYDATMEKWEARLSDLNLLFTFERARELCMRSLFRRAWIAQGRGHRLKIGECHAALRVCGIMDVEQEEAECFVANLIFKGFMKGYISHEQQLVVLSKSNPFPRLADRQAPFEFLS